MPLKNRTVAFFNLLEIINAPQNYDFGERLQANFTEIFIHCYKIQIKKIEGIEFLVISTGKTCNWFQRLFVFFRLLEFNPARVGSTAQLELVKFIFTQLFIFSEMSVYHQKRHFLSTKSYFESVIFYGKNAQI